MAIVCDRCGTKITPRSDGQSQTNIIFISPDDQEFPEYDLCPPCDLDFRKWITGRSTTQDQRSRRASDLQPDTRPRSP